MAVQFGRGVNAQRQQECAMKLGNVCTRNVHTTTANQPLAQAARELLARDVGALAVVETHEGLRRAIGILTDRDIVFGQVRRAADLHCLTVADVMTVNPLTLPESTDVAEAIECMSQMGVRRVLVVNGTGDLSGIASIDDLLPIVADELSVLAKLLHSRPAPASR
jgi:CBS domain-containing protein